MAGRPLRCGYEHLLFLPSRSDCRPRLRSPRVHASVRGQRGAANMMPGSMQFRCAHLIGVIDVDRHSPDHGIIGPASLGDFKGLLSGRQRLGTQVFRPQVAPSCPTGSRCHRPTSYEGSHRRAGPSQPWRASDRGDARPVLPKLSAMSSGLGAS